MWCFFFSNFLIVIERKELSVNSNTDCVNECLFRWNSLSYTLAEEVKNSRDEDVIREFSVFIISQKEASFCCGFLLILYCFLLKQRFHGLCTVK